MKQISSLRATGFYFYTDTLTASMQWRGNLPLSIYFTDAENSFTTFCHPKGGAKMCAVTNFRVRRLPSVKRTQSRFYSVKRSPFFNPPPTLRPISENIAGRVWADARE